MLLISVSLFFISQILFQLLLFLGGPKPAIFKPANYKEQLDPFPTPSHVTRDS